MLSSPSFEGLRGGFTQSIIHKEYFIFVFNLFIKQCSAEYRTYDYLDNRTNKIYTTLRSTFWTRALPIFTEFYEQFYSGKVKKVPNSLDLLTPPQRGLL